MYKFSYYTEPDTEKVMAFIKANAFATVIGIGDNAPVATQVPLTIENKDGKLFLQGHIMRKTDHHLAFEKNKQVLVVFTGPHCFVSAGWYSNPQVGSTWNYMTVQAKGTLSFLDEAGTYNAVKVLSDNYTGTNVAGSFDSLSKEYIDQMMKAITGFSIEVEYMEHTFKLSQNRDLESQKNIITQLQQRGDANSLMIAAEMQQRINQLPD
ncbi:MAG: FMN-binding negative transcriptional regulator [Ferruginibacter sp.]